MNNKIGLHSANKTFFKFTTVRFTHTGLTVQTNKCRLLPAQRCTLTAGHNDAVLHFDSLLSSQTIQTCDCYEHATCIDADGASYKVR